MIKEALMIAGVLGYVVVGIYFVERPTLDDYRKKLILEGWLKIDATYGNKIECKVSGCENCPGFIFTRTIDK